MKCLIKCVFIHNRQHIKHLLYIGIFCHDNLHVVLVSNERRNIALFSLRPFENIPKTHDMAINNNYVRRNKNLNKLFAKECNRNLAKYLNYFHR